MSTTAGSGIGLLVIGAILAFAVRDSIPGVSLEIVGYICMAGGVLAIIFGLVGARAQTSRRTDSTERRSDDQL
jgi:hypothetical protein